MNKRFFKSILLIAIIIIFMLSFVACAKPTPMLAGDFSVVVNRNLPDLKTETDGKFNILTLTDTHFVGYGKNDAKTLTAIKKAINEDTYQLVIITGDMLEGYNKKSKYNKTKAIDDIANLFEESKQYWAYVAGNNDGEYCGDKKAIFSALAKYDYCLVSDNNVGGVGNYTINITNNNDVKLHTMIFIDSGMRGDDGKLIPMTAEQINWYNQVAQNCKNQGIDTSVFMHIPFLEYIEAYVNGVVVDSYNNHLSTKNINAHKDNSKLYEAMLKNGNNKLIVSGHTHGQDYARLYNEMLWLQVRACGRGQWNDNLTKGGAKISYNFVEENILQKYNITNIDFKK